MSEKVDIDSLNHLRRMMSETGLDITADVDLSVLKKQSLKEDTLPEILPNFQKSSEEDRLAKISEHRLMLQSIGQETKYKLLKYFNQDDFYSLKLKNNYLVILYYMVQSGSKNAYVLQFLRDKSDGMTLKSIFVSMGYSDILQKKDFISNVLMAAAEEKEDNIINDIMTSKFGFILSAPLVISFIKSNLINLLKTLVKSYQPVDKNMAVMGLGAMIGGGRSPDNDPVKKNTNQRQFKNKDTIELSQNNRTNSDFALKPVDEPIVVKLKFDIIFPYLIDLKRTDLIETMIEILGEKAKNHINTFISYGFEHLALKYYLKEKYELSEKTLKKIIEKSMWTFLSNIHVSEQEKLLADSVFSAIENLLLNQDPSISGKVLTELIYVISQTDIKAWKENQEMIILNFSKKLLQENAEINRLIFASNPILCCAQLSFLMKKLAAKSRFLKNELTNYSNKIQNIALHLQTGTEENCLYALYLNPLPNNQNMLDYVIKMGTHSLIETRFTKALVFSFWENSNLITGGLSEYSFLHHATKHSKVFHWKIKFFPNYALLFNFQKGITVGSAKFILMGDVINYLMIYYFLDDLTYKKIAFFDRYSSDSSTLTQLPTFSFDVIFSENPIKTVIDYFFIINCWISLLFRCIHVTRANIPHLSFYSFGNYLTFIFFTLVLLCPILFESYQSNIDNKTLITLILIFARIFLSYLIAASLKGFHGSGTIVTVVAKVCTALLPKLLFISGIMILFAELHQNLFHEIEELETVAQAFFKMSENLYGEVFFFDREEAKHTSIYYLSNIFMLLDTFTTNTVGLFMLIAFMTTTYERTEELASYENTRDQYFFIELFKTQDFKGFYGFPQILAIIPGILFPFSFHSAKLKDSLNHMLMRIKYYLFILPLNLFAHLILYLMYYVPYLYFKNIWLIITKSANRRTSSVLINLFGWLIFGLPSLMRYLFLDLVSVVRAMLSNFTYYSSQDKMLKSMTDDDGLYFARFKNIKELFDRHYSHDPEIKELNYLDVMLEIMQGQRAQREFSSHKEKFAFLVTKYSKRWVRNIARSKRKFILSILDGFQDFKNVNLEDEVSSVDVKLCRKLLENLNKNNIAYIRSKKVYAIQIAIMRAQGKDQISIINKLEELENKVESLIKLVPNIPISRKKTIPTISTVSKT